MPLGLHVCLQLVLEKVCVAVGGMFMLIGAGLHIAKEVGWMVSKGVCSSSDSQPLSLA